MISSIAYLGPSGTNTETVALAYRNWLAKVKNEESILSPYPSIAQSLKAVAQQEVKFAVVPVENSIEGSVAMTLDTFWEINSLKIQQALILPIRHSLLSFSPSLNQIQTIYSHPQALGQCQKWIESYLPSAQLIPTNSTTEALKYLAEDLTAAAISAPRASQLYRVPILADKLNDRPENYTRFWAVSLNKNNDGCYVSLAFSVANMPGALVEPLQVFAKRNINLTRIESRPTKQALGHYIFFIDLEECQQKELIQEALSELSRCTEVLKIFGAYDLLNIAIDNDITFN